MRRTLVALALLAAGCSTHAPRVFNPAPTTSSVATTSAPTFTAPAPSAPTSTPAPVRRCRVVGGNRPDRRCTPGARLVATASQVCQPGWAQAHRHVPARVRTATLSAYGNPPKPYELDHLIPLELGGSNDLRNLWPEPGPIPNPKDRVEDRLHRAVCAGTLTLATAQRRIATNWLTAAPGPTSTPTPRPTGTDPRFDTCKEAKAAGLGPYRRGVDPEYDWYQDRDSDGLVCE
jgi:hypothetical protein